MVLAIFDLDNTLIAGDSDVMWGEFMVSNGMVNTESFREQNIYFYEQYKQGVLDIYKYLDFSLKPLTQYSFDELEVWRSQFIQQEIDPIVLKKGLLKVQQHRQKGHYIIIITATNRFITEKIAQKFDCDALLAIELEIIDNRYSGKTIGTITYQDGKVIRLEEWLNEHSEHSMEGSYFYSDSKNDLPLLKQVDNPVVVDPDNELKRWAQKRGWEIISFRE